MWPEWWQRSQPQLSTECATTSLPESTIFFIYNYLKSWFQKEQSRLQLLLASAWNMVFCWPDSPLINRHFFETPPRHFSLTSFKCHVNEGAMHSGLFQEARKGCYFACTYCWFQSSFFQYWNDFYWNQFLEMMPEHLDSAAGTAVAHLVYLHYCHADSFQHLFVILGWHKSVQQ